MSETLPPTSDDIPAPPTHKKSRRKLRVKALFAFNVVLSLVAVTAGSAMFYANQRLASRQVVTIDKVENRTDDINLPVGDLRAKNYLVTGSDNASCIDPNSPYAGSIGDRSGFGERSDTIMVIRVNPLDNQAAILSFPRDLWVTMADSTRKNRINVAFDRKNPNRLIRTIKQNFDIPIDHYVNIDFCAFTEIVNAIGGVRVPFEYRARDLNSGFRVMRAGCYKFTGDHALAYVRSRHYRYFDPEQQKWIAEGIGDWARISRQQDFIKRMVKRANEKASSSPRAVAGILNSALKNVITDDRISPLMLLQLGEAMRDYDSSTMGSYTIQGQGTVLYQGTEDEKSVILPVTNSKKMQDVLSIFQGRATLGTAPSPDESNLEEQEQIAATATTLVAVATTIAQNNTATTIAQNNTATTIAQNNTQSRPSPTTIPPTTTTSTTIVVNVENYSRGITPPADPDCY
jgi:LCP family protein required for cell wall assembly